MRLRSVVGFLVSTTGCNLLVGDWHTRDEQGGGGAPTADATTTGKSTATTAGDGGSGGGRFCDAPTTPLEVSNIDTDVIDIRTAGSFALRATRDRRFLFDSWWDLASDPETSPATDLTAANVGGVDQYALFDPFRAPYPSEVEWRHGEDGTLLDDDGTGMPELERIDQTPVRVGIVATTQFPAPVAVSAPDIFLRTTSWVYASGRIATSVVVRNGGGVGVTIDFPRAEFGHTGTNPAFGWAVSAGERGYVIERTSSPGQGTTVQGINLSLAGVPRVDANPEAYFELLPDPLPGGMSTRLSSALYVAPKSPSVETIEARIEDLRTAGPPDLEVDASTLAYRATATGAVVELALNRDPTARRRRFSPAFEVSGWLPERWQVELDGEVLATDESPVANCVVARHDAASATFLFQYLGSISATATTFVLRERP